MQPTTATLPANTTTTQSQYREGVWRRNQNNARLNIETADDLWNWLQADDFTGLSDWDLTAGETLFFRGQSDITYGLTSSLYRSVRAAKPSGTVAERDLRIAETALLKAMRAEGLGRNLTDFELITVLQHHLMPTRLIDVSRSAMESLFFAVESKHSVDGVLFLLHPNGADQLHYDQPDLPWAHFKTGVKNGDSDWTNRVTDVKHDALDPRMRAQNGTFLTGGLFRSYPGLTFDTATETVPANLRPDVSNLALKFLIQRAEKVGRGWGGAGWVIVIPAEWKRYLLRRLQDECDISENTIYPAFTETARLARHIVTEATAAEQARS